MLTFSDICILARTNALARQFADHLEASGIPVARRKTQERPPDWSAAKLLLTLLANPSNDLVCHRYLVLKLGAKEADRVQRLASIALKSINDYHFHFDSTASPLHALSGQGISRESQELVSAAMLQLNEAGDYSVNDLLLFLNGQEQEQETVGEGVRCQTVHSAKGTEAEIIFLVGFEDGYYPQHRADSDEAECRRLAYVGITRAKQAVHISWCASRPKPFSRDTEARSISPFVGEMGLPEFQSRVAERCKGVARCLRVFATGCP